MGGGLQGISPVRWWHAGLEEKRTHHVVRGTNDALGFTVLGRGVWAGHAKLGAVSEEERAGGGVVELASIIALDSLDGGAELCTCVGEKLRQCRESVRFKPQRKCP
jgi:hypothetical protein